MSREYIYILVILLPAILVNFVQYIGSLLPTLSFVAAMLYIIYNGIKTKNASREYWRLLVVLVCFFLILELPRYAISFLIITVLNFLILLVSLMRGLFSFQDKREVQKPPIIIVKEKGDVETRVREMQEDFSKELGKLEAKAKQTQEVMIREEVNSATIDLRREINEKNQEICRLRDIIKNAKENNCSVKRSRIVTGKKINDELLIAIADSQKEIDIMSPWLNDHVVNETFKNAIDNAIRRGVVVKIVYGIKNNKARRDDFSRDDKMILSKKIIEQLHNMFGETMFKSKFMNSHAKLIICDDEYYIITSCNLLSHNGSLWEEIGDVCYDKKNIETYRSKYFNF